MALLLEAVGKGFRDLRSLQTEETLAPLRDREDFRLLMLDLAFPAEPFAR